MAKKNRSQRKDNHQNVTKNNSKTFEVDRESSRESLASIKIKVKPMKVNGFNRPFHPFQISSWVVFGINLGSYFIIIAP